MVFPATVGWDPGDWFGCPSCPQEAGGSNPEHRKPPTKPSHKESPGKPKPRTFLRSYNSFVPLEPMNQLQVDLADMKAFGGKEKATQLWCFLFGVDGCFA